MRATAHTPGPWIIQRSRTIRPNYALICGQDWHDLAHVVVRFSGDKEDDATGLANARLIAAAPDLLFALQRLMDIIELRGPRSIAPHKSPIEEVRATLGKAEYEAARAAIAKARGE